MERRASILRTTGAAPFPTGTVPTSTISPYHEGLNGVNQPMNMLLKDALWCSLGVIACAVLVFRIFGVLWAKFRQISTMSHVQNEGMPFQHQQTYWRLSQWTWTPTLKKHLVYAPLWKHRHNKEIRLSSAARIGTLPSRLQMLVLLLYLLGNTAYMLVLDFGKSNRFALCAELRGRAGTLAIANMLPLIIMAGRNNPLIWLLGVSFDTYNLLHRWIGRIVLFDVAIHTVAWAIPSIADSGWSELGRKVFDGLFLSSGSVGVIAMFLISAMGFSPVRHAFYETFLVVHIVLALTAIICIWLHCATSQLPGALPQLPWIQAVVAIWVSERFARILRLVYVNWRGAGFSNATCEAMPGEATRVTVQLPRSLRVNPGSHAYLRFRSVRAWENHPFSIAWVEDRAKYSQLPHNAHASNTEGHEATTELTFIIAARSGMTRQLYEKVLRAGVLQRVAVAVEGPYSGHQSLDSYGHVVLFAGSTGITHQISYARHILTSYEAGLIGTRRLLLLWVIREHECIEWVLPYLRKMLRSPFCHNILRIKVFVTRGVKESMVFGASSIISFHSGRPEVLPVLKREVQRQTGAMCVTVCGPGALADDVRGAVRVMQGQNVIDFFEESFTW